MWLPVKMIPCLFLAVNVAHGPFVYCIQGKGCIHDLDRRAETIT